MKLESIGLLNFLSHQDTYLDFKTIDAAIFLGPNGSGKSSGIVDALRWVLFGMSRFTDIDAVIRTGQTETQVETIFRLYDNRYRILRKRSIKTKKGKSELEFNIQKNGKWKSEGLTGSSIGATEENIQHLLKMDDKILLASMVARDGSGDFFAQSDPAERKRLLYSMLDLDRYQLLMKLANTKASKIDLDSIEKELEKLKTLIADRQELEEKLFIIKLSLEISEEELKKTLPQLQILREEKVRLETKLQEASVKMKKLKEDSNHLGAEGKSIQKQIIIQEDILNQETAIRQAVQKQKEYEESLKHLQSDMEKENVALSGRQKIQKDSQDTRASYMNGLLKVRETKSDIEKKQGIINSQITNAEKQSNILAKVPCPAEFQVKCPAIAQAREAQDMLSLLKKNRNQLDQNLPMITQKEQEVMTLIDSIAKRIMEEQKLIEKKQKICEEFRQKIKSLQDLISSTSKKAALISQIEVALSKKEMLQKEAGKILADTKKVEQELKTIETDKEKYLQIVQTLQPDIANIESEISIQEKACDVHKENMIKLHVALEQIVIYRRKIDQLSSEFTILAKEKNLYIILANAFKTIPTLILEHAKPIVEQEANQILTRISNTGMRLSLPLLKVLKTSDKIVETLEIKVQDNIGERPYQMFSSGERVRLDLALRIGLSRLLMIRSGTRIGTLILDEGFGPLDQEGIESFKECLRELQRQKEFELLIALTHIDSLKDIFPIHIIFEKKNGISHAQVFD